ncbi:MAG: 2-oxoacid:ferredoxin oxidoreductase subunit beta [Planctomycetota bacterium]|jgi:2-oxoglutarate ferredoxin oxidoreductase subunit beta
MTEHTEVQDALPALTKRDFQSDQEVRWCPGCGDYSILAQMQKVMPELGVPKEKIVFFSGIGCSSRFPYYMNTYGFHTIHGRAPTVATGLKSARPDLSIWVITGDGDGLSIGGNHMLHALRRNMDINVILFNNRIYGLTKGQASPTSEIGKVTKSSPMGTIELPIDPVSFALASEATFVARTLATDPKHLADTLRRSAAHKGSSFVEVFQNCNIFNDGAFEDFAAKKVRDDNMIYLEHRKPLLFGKDKNKGLELECLRLNEIDVQSEDDLKRVLVHDETLDDPTQAYMLSRLTYPDHPVALGVFRYVVKPTWGEMITAQIAQDIAKKGPGKLDDLLQAGNRWVVTPDGEEIRNGGNGDGKK